jgi:hypothetical protein
MTEIGISEVVPCPDQKMDTDVSDCSGCLYYAGRTDSSILCNYTEEVSRL